MPGTQLWPLRCTEGLLQLGEGARAPLRRPPPPPPVQLQCLWGAALRAWLCWLRGWRGTVRARALELLLLLRLLRLLRLLQPQPQLQLLLPLPLPARLPGVALLQRRRTRRRGRRCSLPGAQLLPRALQQRALRLA